MYKFGINSICFSKDWPDDFSEIIKKAASIGYDTIELFTAFLLLRPFRDAINIIWYRLFGAAYIARRRRR